MVYDVIIIGAGPAGLFCGCNHHNNLKCLILERKARPGIKLLMSGSGQCNVTHDGSIKDFLKHYGDNGKKIRQILYTFNNDKLIEYFESRHLKMTRREDGKVFPHSMNAKDVLDILLNDCKKNNVEISFNTMVSDIKYKDDEKIFEITSDNNSFHCRNLVVATGGCSYPTTGSDGNIFAVLEALDIKINKPKPALVPIYVEDYPYSHLSGISFEKARIELYRSNKKIHTHTGDVLFTHNNFSGPGILDISRYIEQGDAIVLDYYNRKSKEEIINELKYELTHSGNKILNTIIKEYFNFPKRFISIILESLKADGSKKASQVSHKELIKIIDKVVSDRFIVKKTGDFNIAMATKGGVSLDDLDIKKLLSIKYPNLYFAGEVLDVDGDTGGYNLQFAFSSGIYCAGSINGYGNNVITVN